jgi:hypothetical protein
VATKHVYISRINVEINSGSFALHIFVLGASSVSVRMFRLTVYILLARQNILFVCDSLATLLNGIAADRTDFTCIFMSYLVIILKGEEAVCVCVRVCMHACDRKRETIRNV